MPVDALESVRFDFCTTLLFCAWELSTQPRMQLTVKPAAMMMIKPRYISTVRPELSDWSAASSGFPSKEHALVRRRSRCAVRIFRSSRLAICFSRIPIVSETSSAQCPLDDGAGIPASAASARLFSRSQPEELM